MPDEVKGKRRRDAATSRSPTPATPDNQSTRDLMLDVAAELFSKKGYESVGIREIAEATGVTLPSLYYHFGDKRGLYEEAYRREFVRGSGEFLTALRTKTDPAERIYELTVAMCERLTGPGPLGNMLLRYFLEADPKFVQETARETFFEWFELLAEDIKRLDKKRGAREIAFVVTALAFGIFSLQPLNNALEQPTLLPHAGANLARCILTVVFPGVDWTLQPPKPRSDRAR